MQKINEPAPYKGTEFNTYSRHVAVKTANRFPLITLTRPGTMYLVVILILLLTAINYSNHNILVVALFLLSLLVVSLVMAVRVFRGVELSLGEIKQVFAGQEVHVPVNFKRRSAGDAIALQIIVWLDNGDSLLSSLNLPGSESGIEQFSLSPRKRGRYNLIKVQISSSFPFGLFRVRRSFDVAQSFWVYVAPADDATTTTTKSGVRKTKRGKERGDSVFLRQYRLGDPVRRIHKKSLAMGQNILVKDIEVKAPDSQWLLWESLPDLAIEKRLQILTRQVLNADQQGRNYGLALPKGKVNPARGEAHKHQCLRMLAEY
ncbi:hypothetical protein [Kaarinaea lacus]